MRAKAQAAQQLALLAVLLACCTSPVHSRIEYTHVWRSVNSTCDVACCLVLQVAIFAARFQPCAAAAGCIHHMLHKKHMTCQNKPHILTQHPAAANLFVTHKVMQDTGYVNVKCASSRENQTILVVFWDLSPDCTAETALACSWKCFTVLHLLMAVSFSRRVFLLACLLMQRRSPPHTLDRPICIC